MALAYDFPEVYVNSIPKQKAYAIPNSSGTIGGLIGRAKRGVRNKPVYITSWTEYIEQFANGLASPFTTDSYLAHAVYGFFQNGGSELYVLNATDSLTVKTATAKLGELTFEAKDPGDWAGGDSDGDGYDTSVRLWVELKEDTDADVGDDEKKLILSVYYGDVANDDTFVEDFSFTTDKDGKILMETFENRVNINSEFLSSSADNAALTDSEGYITLKAQDSSAQPVAFAGGADGSFIGEAGTHDTITNVFHYFDYVDDICMLAHADDNTPVTVKKLLDYCWSTNERRNRLRETHNNLIAIFGVESEEVTGKEALAYGKQFKGKGVYVFPWGGFIDPLSDSTKVVNIPIVGHYMGRVANIIETNGFQRVPAGTDSPLTGIESLSQTVDPTLAGKMNTANIIVVLERINYGIVIWGGRSIDDGRYINSLLLEGKIRRDLYNGLQPFVFKPNGEQTWSEIKSVLDIYMNNLWELGTFNGNTASEAYIVVCDSSNNTDKTIQKKELHVMVMYREFDAAEFIVVDIMRTTEALS